MLPFRTTVFLSILFLTASAHAATISETLGDASIDHDPAAGTWTIQAGGASLKIASDASRDFQIVSMVSPSGGSWITSASPSTVVTVNGSARAFGSRADGFQYEGTATSNDGHLLHLDAAFLLQSAGLRVTRHVAAADGSPTFEIWTTFDSLGTAATLSNLNAYQLSMPAGTVHWLNGLQG